MKRTSTTPAAGHLIGYARVSTDEQRLDPQIDALTAAGVAADAIWTDKASGLKADRPGLANALKAVQAGDVLVVWKLDRLARSTIELYRIAGQLKEKGAALRSITQPIDTSGPAGTLVFAVLAAVAEIEAGIISERTVAGLAAAKKRGVHVGRPRKLTDKQVAMAARLLSERQGAETARQVAEQFGVDRTTLYRLVREYNARKGKK